MDETKKTIRKILVQMNNSLNRVMIDAHTLIPMVSEHSDHFHEDVSLLLDVYQQAQTLMDRLDKVEEHFVQRPRRTLRHLNPHE